MKVENFSENFEKSVTRVGEHFKKNLENPELKNATEREIIKNSIESASREVYVKNDNDSGVKPVKSDEKSTLPTYLDEDPKAEDEKQTVKHLIQVALDDGLEKAIYESKQKSAFIQDALRDALVDKLLPELKKRGILK